MFPSLATRPFYLTGQSYAGRFIVSLLHLAYQGRLTQSSCAAVHCEGALLRPQPSGEASCHDGWRPRLRFQRGVQSHAHSKLTRPFSHLLSCLTSFVQLRLIETYPQLIGYDTDVYDYFKTQ